MSQAGPARPGGGLAADVRVNLGGFTLAVAIEVGPGEVLAVLGPNGSGKSTLLATLAGTLVPQHGRVEVAGRVLTDVRHGAVHAALPPERRGVGLLGQDPLVFPHLDARENVAFAPRAAGAGRRVAQARAEAWLDAVGVGDLARRRVHQLSGGQRQRVALARALAAEPAVLGLDEPFAALDVRTAAELRPLVREQVRRTGTAAVLVTHDVIDVVAVADRMVVLHDGAVVAEGTPAEVLGAPADPFTAALAGVNLVVGEVRAGPGGPVVVADGALIPLPGPLPVTATGRVRVTFPPTAVRIGGTGGATWPATVVGVEPALGGVRVTTAGGVAVIVTASEAIRTDLSPGTVLELGVDPALTVVRPG